MSIEISVLLPTRGRTDILKRSLLSLADLADDTSRIEMLLAFDDDDTKSSDWCMENVLPELDDRGITYSLMQFPRLGYIRLNEYVNALAARGKGRWMMFWGDDAVMETQGWDTRILEVTDFRVLRIPTHNLHPYAIFPIVPKKWIDLLGCFSPHQLSDSTVSQMGYMLDIIKNIDVTVTHDRFDITGNNRDETWENRPMLEGNPQDPRDFNYPTWRQRRMADCRKLSEYLREQGQDTSWFDNVLVGKQDPWAKMISPEYDPNRQVARMS